MILQMSNVRKDFVQPGSSIEVLKGIDLAIEKPETLAIVGHSGSGKTTLLTLLAGLDRPTSGAITVHGHDLAALGEKELAQFRAKHLSIVFQQFHLLSNLTALENVALPLEIMKVDNANLLAEEELLNVGLAHRRHHFPSQMSGGECQRVAIARSLVMKPLVLLADEPSGNLDAQTGNQVMNLLFDLAKSHSTTLILVTHNEQLAARCNRQFLLAEGMLRQQAGART